MPESNPFGDLPIHGYEPASIVGRLAEQLRTMPDAEVDQLLARVEADIKAKKEMAGARAALESVMGLVVRVLS